MSFDLTNAPATFMDLIHTVLKRFINSIDVVINDDSLIYSKTEEMHDMHLKEILTLLRNMKCMPSSQSVSFG